MLYNFVLSVGLPCIITALKILYQQYIYTKEGSILSPVPLLTALKGSR